MDKLNKVLFTTSAKVVGGRNGHVTSKSGLFDIEVAKPKSMGGPGGDDKSNPEEFFACGYAACFGGAMEHVAETRKLEISKPEVQAKVSFGLTDSGVAIAVQLNGQIENIDDEVVLDIMKEAHEKVCPYSKATRGNIEVTLGLLE
jgi:Ohr subfamily peroxiredoxin